MGKGRTYELDTKRDLHQAVDNRYVWVTLPDYSGIAADTFCDLAVIHPTDYHGYCSGGFVELKKRSGDSGKRQIVMSGSSEGESGKNELERLIDGCPNWGEPLLGVKFDHRELLIYHAEYLLQALTGDVSDFSNVHAAYHYGDEELFGARFTGSDSISIRKPTLDEWRSSTAGTSGVRKILWAAGVERQNWEVPTPDDTPIANKAQA